jgi:hypothetical protein
MPQLLFVHDGVPWLELHAWLQELQWLGLVLRSTSQPVAAFWSQLPNPAAQPMPHTPSAQVAVPLVLLQASPQPLQCCGFVLMLVSQPLAAVQSPNPGAQVIPHVPFVQLAVPFTVLQALPQALQCNGLLLRSVSHPVAALLSQSPYPAAHAMAQPVTVQVGVPCTVEHGWLQARQWLVLLEVLTSQPLDARPSQLAKGAVQLIPQTPATHVAVPLVELQAGTPQPPQLVGEVLVLVSHPLLMTLSQLP